MHCGLRHIQQQPSVIQGAVKFQELLGTDSVLDFWRQFLELGDVTRRLHRKVQPKSAQSKACGQADGNGIGP